jgi:hypothetical protein
VQHQDQKIELQNGVEMLAEIVEQGLQVALLRNRFADNQKRFKLAAGVLQPRRRGNPNRSFLRVLHKIQNSTLERVEGTCVYSVRVKLRWNCVERGARESKSFYERS